MSDPQPGNTPVGNPAPKRQYVKPRLDVVPMENALASKSDLSPFYSSS